MARPGPGISHPSHEPIEGAVWVVLPTYNERDNIEAMVAAIKANLPLAHALIVDDNSPDGTGQLADALAAGDDRVSVFHRPGKAGLGEAYRAGFREVLEQPGIAAVIQMDCDFSHDPADLPRLLEALSAGADLAIGSRYVRGGSTPGWDLRRRIISRSGSLFARSVLLVPYRDLTGGFKAWRPDLLRRLLASTAYAQGYGFQIEMTWLAHRSGARVAELPIAFRDRQLGQSKMSGAIMREALLMVLRLRLRAMGMLRDRPAVPARLGDSS